MIGTEIERLIQLLAKLPGLGPRSARRAVLYMMKRRETVMTPLVKALAEAAEKIVTCHDCGNLDTVDPCAICADGRREPTTTRAVAEVPGLWARERAGTFKGRYHVLGGVLSAIDGMGPEDLNIAGLIARAGEAAPGEVTPAPGATAAGHTTSHARPARPARRGAHGRPPAPRPPLRLGSW